MVTKVDKEALFDNFSLELRRGALVLVVLAQLRREQYGYSLKQALADGGIDINEGTLYPLLRRLEKQGLLESDWRVVDNTRPRRYYRISQAGETILTNLTGEWQTLIRSVNEMLSFEGEHA